MRRLNIAPTRNQLDRQSTTEFLQTLEERCNVYMGTTDPTAAQIPSGQWVFHKNTTSGKVRLWNNDGGTLRSVYLGTSSADTLADLGGTAIGIALFTAATALAARNTLGATTVGNAVFTAATAGGARTALGSTTVGDALFITASAAAARTTLGSGATGDTLFQAATAASARSTLGAGTIGDSIFTSSSASGSRATLGSTTVGDAVFVASTASAGRTALGQTWAVIDRAYDEYLTNADLTVTIPFDDTIPQITEGTQILTATITPKSVTSRLRVIFQGWGATAVSGDAVVAALFVNGGTNAVAAETGPVTVAAGGIAGSAALVYEYVPGTTTAQALTLRVGGTAGTIRMNGTTAARRFGGVSRSTLIIEEYAS